MSRRLVKLRPKAKANWPDDDQQMHQQWTVKVEKAIPGSVKRVGVSMPPIAQAKYACPNRSRGCTWTFTPADMPLHVTECKFRSYGCIGSQLNVFRCDWTGMQHQIEDHLVNEHGMGELLSYNQCYWIVFSVDTPLSGIKLVDAFNRRFLFYTVSNVTLGMVYFVLICFGRRVEARQYYYEFEIRPQEGGGVRRIKFTEYCVSDCEDLGRIMAEERCAAVSFGKLKRFVHDGIVPFRFIVKRVEKRNEF
uniref:E3 ubiquitin-protein ligase n=1 Tax=Culex pipiens TaxID=7175 RepID=A0A8D8KHF9_CULPI